MFWDGRKWLAHRYAWQLTHTDDELTAETEIDHLCRNRACVNPRHLQAVPKGFNRAQGTAVRVQQQLAKTHCKQGHERLPENTHVSPSTGRKSCLVCHAVSHGYKFYPRVAA